MRFRFKKHLGDSVGGIQFESLARERFSFDRLARNGRSKREIDVNGGSRWSNIQSLPKFDARVGKAPNMRVLHAQVPMRVAIRRIDVNGFFELRNGLGNFVGAGEQLGFVSRAEGLFRNRMLEFAQ